MNEKKDFFVDFSPVFLHQQVKVFASFGYLLFGFHEVVIVRELLIHFHLTNCMLVVFGYGCLIPIRSTDNGKNVRGRRTEW